MPTRPVKPLGSGLFDLHAINPFGFPILSVTPAARSLSDMAFVTRRGGAARCEAAGPEKPEVYSLLGVRHLTQRI